MTEENVFDKQPVLSTVQDSKGRLWFAGANDIYCYNSEHIRNLKDQDSSWNKIGYITKLTINAYDDLFIASSTGLHLYNTNTQLFVTLPTTIQKKISEIPPLDILDICLFDGRLFIASKKGLLLVNYKDTLQNVIPLIQNKPVYALNKAADNTLYFATSNSIAYLSLESNTPTIRKLLNIPLQTTSRDLITTLLYDQQHIWIGTKFHGVFYYNPKKKQFVHYHENNSNLLSNYVRKITKGTDGRIWIGTLKGLSIYKDNDHFQNYHHNSLTPHSLSQNSIYDIFVDKQQITWIGTYFGGMNMIYPTSLDVKVFSTQKNVPYQLNSDIIGSLVESENGYWIGTEEEGINFIDKKTGQIKSVPHYTKSNLIKNIYLKNDKLYIAQFAGGYSIANLKNNTVQHFMLSQDTLATVNNVFSIHADADTEQTLYIGTNAGLYVKHKQDAPPKHVTAIPNTTINKIKQDGSGNIYIQEGNNLYVKKHHKNTFESIKAIENLSVNDFFIEGDHLWITAADQVYRLTDFEKLDYITRIQGNHLGAIVKQDNRLWLASKQGLIYYDLQSQYRNILTKEDGLPSNNLGNAKIYLDKRKNIFMATQNGLVTFSTKNIRFNPQPPDIFLSSIKVNDQILSSDRIKKEDKTQTIIIDLKYNETFLSIDFASSNLIKPTKNRYRYMLTGLDKYWKEMSSPTIQYNNLAIGTHTLRIYASNNDGVWSEDPLLIKLVVHPPFYLTWWAFIIYAILFLIIIHFIIKFIVEREILINSEKEHDKKIKFFTQISHEIRTPLTLITAPLDDIINETANQSHTQQKIKRIKKNTNKLLAVINELLDFNKFDEKQQKLKLQHIALSTYLEDCFYLLSDLAQLKELNYYIRRLDKTGLFWIDPLQFDKVMFNLLSNAIKYTPTGGTVYLDLIKTSQGVEISIMDNGIGVADGNQFKIFEEYYRQENTEDVIGTGIGLALTKKIIDQHNGTIVCKTISIDHINWTTFSISLPQKEIPNATIPAESSFLETAVNKDLQISKRESDKQEIILIVEDNKELLEVISTIFQHTYQVITATHGQDGLDKAKRYIPSLIISDMMMPKMNGLQLCQLLKEDILTSHIPFILLTAVTDQQVHTETLKYGANIYMTKPFDKNQLYLSARNLLAIAQKQRKDFQINVTINNEIDQKFITNLDKLIEEHLMDDAFDVNYIAQAMGMSAPILYRKLRAITDLSLNNYVKSYRLNKAKEMLLRSPHMNISEVAYAVGFSDRKYFSKEFKKLFGQNPSEYIAENT